MVTESRLHQHCCESNISVIVYSSDGNYPVWIAELSFYVMCVVSSFLSSVFLLTVCGTSLIRKFMGWPPMK